MKAEKITTENIDLNIEEVTLLSEEEYVESKDNIPFWGERWWLRAPGNTQNNAVYVYTDGSLYGTYVNNQNVVVRPALIISNLKYCHLSVGNQFKVANRTWTVISNTIALCDGSIGKQCFNLKIKEENSNNYETSDIKKYVDEWAAKESLIKKNIDCKRLLQIFQAYVENDYQASCNIGYIKETLEKVATHKEIEELGFGWLYPEEC